MSLPVGTRLGLFEIIGPIGAGGMGEVYRAKDTRLDREVAIKVLPESMATDPERRARFEREAKAVAALSHPNILAIHEFGVENHVAYAVMELLHGETLRDRLRGGPMTVRKATEAAIQIARGLAAAHDKGLIHRDLKPENIFLLEDGQVKILDFGLAKNLADARDSAGQDAQTMTVGTNPGTVMGTMGYMAPEQVRGQAIDARADLFALGAVLYEMLSGQRAFQRDTAADTMTAILKDDPPELTGTRVELSPSLDRIIRHCLEKNPAERFQTARDVAFALGSLSATSVSSISGSGAAPVIPAKSGLPRWLTTLAVVAITAVVVTLVDGALAPDAATAPRFTQKTFEQNTIITARFMPDGTTVIFSAARTGNEPHLFELRNGVLEARPFGPARTHLLSISSKGELLILTDAHFINHRLFGGTLSRMAIDGSPRPLMTGVRDADWAPDGSAMAIVRALPAGDQLEYPVGTVLYQSTSNGYVSDVRVSPDGTSVAFMDHQQRFDDRGWVKVVDRAKKVTPLAGEFWGEEGIAWSRDGATVYFSANDRPEGKSGANIGVLSYQIRAARLSKVGTADTALTSPGDFLIHDVSADGRWLATRDDQRYGVGVRLAGASEDRDMSFLNQNWGEFLSDDGSRLLFSDGTAGANYGVVWRKTDGSPVVQLGEGNATGLSPDGAWALAQIFTPRKLLLYPLGAGDAVTVNIAPLTAFSRARFFPDSKQLLISGTEASGAHRAYRVTVPTGALMPALPPEVMPRGIRPDGREILAFDTKLKTMQWYPVDEGAPRPALGMNSEDTVIGWAQDGVSPLVSASADVPVIIERVDTATGKRSVFKTISNSEGHYALGLSSMSSDGRQYAYSYWKRLSTLFVVSGAK